MNSFETSDVKLSTSRQAVFLPEASDYIGRSQEESLSLCLPADKSPFILGLQEDAKKHSLPISVGVHEPSDDPKSKRIKNSLIWIDEHGKIAQRYQKLHLFDLELENGPVFKESRLIEPGNEIQPPYQTALGKIGSMICFDLRFPEIALALKRQQADIILYPSAFTVPTGEAHWHSLIRARAIECQAYVIAAAQAGEHHKGRRSYGHSIIVDPWGKVLAELNGDLKDGSEVIFAEIDLDLVKKVKREMPLLRRT